MPAKRHRKRRFHPGALLAGSVLLLALGWTLRGLGVEPRASLGLTTVPLDETAARHLGLTPGIGLVIETVDPDSPAAGVLEPHDILTRLDDQWLISDRQLEVLGRRSAPGDAVRLTFLRGGRSQVKQLTWGRGPAFPDPPPAAAAPGDPLQSLLDQFEQDAGPGLRRQIEELHRLPRFGDFARTFEEIIDRFRVDIDALIEPEPPAPAPPPADSTRSSVRQWTQDDLTITLSESEHGRRLKATAPDGSVVYDGPIDTEAQRRRLPQPLPGLLDRLLQGRPDGDDKHTP